MICPKTSGKAAPQAVLPKRQKAAPASKLRSGRANRRTLPKVDADRDRSQMPRSMKTTSNVTITVTTPINCNDKPNFGGLAGESEEYPLKMLEE
mmetsp:Transcript_11136/g.20943  ORF Transcript_11136/g.20943 Transcript_11136/m.20943 type:complete len:94 (-) Transcript_11136:118-399(-)